MRTEFRHRPLLWIAVGLTCGISTVFAPWPWALAFVLCLAMRELRMILPLLAAFCIGFVLRPPLPELVRERSTFEGTVELISMPQKTSMGEKTLAVIGKKRYWLYLSGEEPLALGDVINVGGELRPLSEAAGFSSGAVGTIKVETLSVQKEGFFLWHIGRRVSDHFRATVDHHLSVRPAALVKGICFNQTDGFDQQDWDAFQRFGVIHLLSASGFHVFVVTGLLLFILTLLPIPRSVQLIIVMGALMIFAVAAGLRPPIIRSILMAGIAFPAYLFRREFDGISAASLAGVFNLVVNPEVVVDLGFQLSMVSTYALVMWLDARTLAQKPRWQLIALPTVVATLATLPLTAFVFGEISLTGVLGNLLIAPLVAVLVLLALSSWLVGIIFPPLGDLGWRLIEPLGGLTNSITQWGSQTPGSIIAVPAFSVLSMVLMYSFLFLFWRKVNAST